MKAILIHPYERTVDFVEVHRGRDISDHIKGSLALAHIFSNGDTLYVNDDGIGEGLDALEGKAEVFRICQFDLGLHQTFYGIGLIVGDEDDVGEITDVKSSLEEIMRSITFIWPHALAASGPRN